MKYLYFILGLVFMLIGMIGVVLPILPTTPFLLAALFFFTKSSSRAKIWFQGTKLYQNHLNDFVTRRAMTLRTKVMLLSFASTMLLIAFLMMNNIYGRITIVLLVIFKYYYFISRIETIKKVGND
ncbi:YbaN family protein [Thomasclavelia saccharogumia]|uniref:YbaN family protein n=1 Tax=Thomasclavelia saccharogumia TaxID=341225 RepID=UPI00047D3BCF|nr:YbaN family protein [Thomasclavelia saccharogumia]